MPQLEPVHFSPLLFLVSQEPAFEFMDVDNRHIFLTQTRYYIGAPSLVIGDGDMGLVMKVLEDLYVYTRFTKKGK
jgi:hypothetical protein